VQAEAAVRIRGASVQRDVDLLEIKQINSVADFSGKRVLEVGCGDGRISNHLSSSALEYVAIDPDLKNRDVMQNASGNIRFEMGYGEKLKYLANHFDLMLFALSLHHQNAPLSLSEAYRVLKPNGMVIILEPTENGEIQKLFHLYNDETETLRSAQAAIELSQFKRLKRSIFKSTWSFINRQELFEFDFGQGSKPNNDKRERIKELVGNKISQFPILLEDELVLSLLKKEAT
jgi:ubiquinone/menaquinone biosynthesis C-methylase UbiE